MRYAVREHRYGRLCSEMPDGQLWEHDMARHEWTATHDFRKKTLAIAEAEASPTHAVVVDAGVLVVFDNGKEPIQPTLRAR